jgi:putative hydrolase of HD superfamily
MAASTQPSALAFFRICGKIKDQKRSGWVLRNVSNPESVGDHMYRMAMMTMLMNDVSIDKTKCMKMALVHDLAEAIVGDITPHDGISKAEKHTLEYNAMKDIEALIPHPEGKTFVIALVE